MKCNIVCLNFKNKEWEIIIKYYHFMLLIITFICFITCNGIGPDESTGEVNIIWTSQPTITQHGFLFFWNGNSAQKISNVSGYTAVNTKLHMSGNNVVWRDYVLGDW